MERYELTMTTDYVGHWGEWEAVREFLQNAIDHGEPTVEAIDNHIVITSKGVTLSPQTLLLGASTKRDDSDSIGQFGEGMKLACLVLCRLGKKVVIHNGDVWWSPSLIHSEKYDCEILCIDETPSSKPSKDLIVDIADVECDLTTKYIPNMLTNQIIDDGAGVIYVAGLYVCTLKEFKHGYNFAADTMELGRDRQMVSTFNVTWEVARQWNRSKREQEIYDMLMDEEKDVESMDSYHDRVGEAIAERFVTRYSGLIPVSTQEDINAVGGQGYQVVPKIVKYIVRKFHDFKIKMFGSPVSRLTAWQKRWNHKLSEEARKELLSIIKQMGGGQDEKAA